MIPNATENTEQAEFFCAAERSINYFNHFGNGLTVSGKLEHVPRP